jgi:SAM-dependent methyltransferase
MAELNKPPLVNSATTDLAREDRLLCDKYMCGEGEFDYFTTVVSSSSDGGVDDAVVVVKTQRPATWDVLTPEPAGSLCPFVPTSMRRVPRLIEFASIGSRDVVVDLGCGDGSLLIEIARLSGCRCVGIDLRSDLVEQAALRAQHTDGVDAKRLEWRCESFLDSRLSELAGPEHDVIVVHYLTPDGIAILADHLHAELQRSAPHGFRIVSLCYHPVDERFLPPAAIDDAWALQRFER